MTVVQEFHNKKYFQQRIRLNEGLMPLGKLDFCPMSILDSMRCKTLRKENIHLLNNKSISDNLTHLSLFFNVQQINTAQRAEG